MPHLWSAFGSWIWILLSKRINYIKSHVKLSRAICMVDLKHIITQKVDTKIYIYYEFLEDARSLLDSGSLLLAPGIQTPWVSVSVAVFQRKGDPSLETNVPTELHCFLAVLTQTSFSKTDYNCEKTQNKKS